MTKFVQDNLDLVGLDPSQKANTSAGEKSFLDYACGNGVLSRALGPYVDKIQALDLSPEMIKQYEKLAATSDIKSVQQATARVGNLLEEQESASDFTGSEYQDFSLIGIGVAFHHFDNFQLSIDRLAARLKSGGSLLILDLIEDSGVRMVKHRPVCTSSDSHDRSKITRSKPSNTSCTSMAFLKLK